MTWRDHLLPQEKTRVEHIEATRPALTREFKKISDRCRKRMTKENGR
jgi:hypothetical protein